MLPEMRYAYTNLNQPNLWGVENKANAPAFYLMNLPRRLKVVNSSKTVIALYFLLTTGYMQEPYLVIEMCNKVSYGWAYIRVNT